MYYYYEPWGREFNLAHVVAIDRLKDCTKPGYRYQSKDIPESRSFFGLFQVQPARPIGYYLDTWDTLKPVSKEQATYKETEIMVWLVNQSSPMIWKFDDVPQMEDFIAKCKASSEVCKFVR